MKWTRISVLALLLAAFVLALPAAAHDSASAFQTYTTEDGLASVQFPADWVSELGNDSDSILSLKLANIPSALEKDLFSLDDVFEPGEVHIEVAAIALAELASSIPDNLITTTSTPADILDVLTSQGMPDEFEFGESGEITINDIAAVRVNLIAEERGEGQLLLTVIDQKWIVAIILYAAPGEGDKWDITARDILGSVTIKAAQVNQTYSSLAGNFTVSFPTGWNFDDRSDDTSDDVIGGVFASNHDAKFKNLYSDVFESGDIVMEMVIADLAKLATLPELADATSDTTAAEVMQGFVDAKIISNDVEYGEVKSAEIEGGTAAQADLAYEENGDGRMLVIKRDDGTFVFLAYYAAIGELQSAEDAARQIYATLLINEPMPEATSEPLSLTNTASNGVGMLMYPDSWFSRKYGDEGIYIANTKAALEKSFGDSLASGEANILYSFGTVEDYMQDVNLPPSLNISPLQLLQATTLVVGDSVTFTEVETTFIGDLPAARVDFSTPTFAGTAWMISYPDDRLITVQLLAAVGEVEQWQQIALDVAETAAFAPQ